MTDSVNLNGTTYTLSWISPAEPPLDTWVDPPLRSNGPYHDHVNPLYNLQEDVPAEPPADGNWPARWRRLARSLPATDPFALVASVEDRIAGLVRVLPKTRTRPRFGAWSAADHRHEWRDDILWIGAACVDLPGVEDGLDATMLEHVITRAREIGVTKLQALAWSDISVYALWGQALRQLVYARLCFRPIADVRTNLNAFPDMLAGHHGPVVRAHAESALATGTVTRETADHRHIVERVL